MNSKLVEKYIPFINNLSTQYQYDSNITHLLYLILPAFIAYYSIKKEPIILNTIKNTPILISPKKDKNIQAYYTSIPYYKNEKITTKKYIILQNYKNISLIQLLDNLVHEFNHAIHSNQQEIIQTDKYLLIRTGLTYSTYTLPNLEPIKKDSSYVLEEILNTYQTTQIINLIKNYHDPESATIYSINQETNSTYQSKSYQLETTIFKVILENKTFVSTLNNLRLSGNIQEIEEWFDHITNQKNSYQTLNQNLENLMILEKKLSTTKYLKGRIIKKIKSTKNKILNIIHTFHQNCTYK